MDFNQDTKTISEILILDPGTNSLTIAGTSGLVIPSGTTAQRAASLGALRVNTDNSTIEWYNGASWVTIGAQTGNLAALSALSGTGFVTQTGAGTFAERSITGTAGRISVNNGDGVSGAPTIDLSTAGTAGTYTSVTTDAYGRVTSGSTTQAFSTLTGTPTTVAGYGITNAVVNLGGTPGILSNTFALRPAAGTAGRLFISTDTLTIYYDTGTVWSVIEPAMTGDVTRAAGGTVTTLATVNSNVGSFGSATLVPVITVNAKGLVTAVSTASISSAITLAGDITGTGTTGATTTTTLATVNSNVGTFGSNSVAPVITVNAKGLVTAVTTASITPASIGAINTNQLGIANGVATLDGTGRLTTAQIPVALVGAMVYQGVWNAATNTPTLVSGVGTKGQYYKVNVAGSTTIDGNNNWQVGDMIVYDGATWDAIDGLTSEVTSVFGRVGAVSATLASADFANQGSTTTFLKGNAAGNPTWSAVSLTTDVSGVLQAAQTPAYTGDITKPAGSLATTLATVNSNVGVFGSATQVGSFTVNAKGLITAASNITIPNTIALTGDGTANVTTGGSGALTLATVNSNTGSFGSSTLVPIITVNAKGLVTAMSTASISGAINVTGGDLTLSGTTGTAITNATLATVNSNVGSFGSATQIPVVTVNAKGLVTAASTVSVTPANIGAVSNAGGTPSIQTGTFAAMPAPSAAATGRLYVTSDTNSIYRDTGTVWSQVSEATLLYTENASTPVASTVSGANASSIGSGNTAAATAVFATGIGARSSVYGAEVRANGSFSVPGDAQSGKYVLRNSTTNATLTEVFADGTAARIVLPNNSSVTYSAQVVAQRTDATGSHGAWEIKGLISRDATAATTALVGNRSKTVLTRPAGWDVEVSADTTNGALVFKVTGAAAQTIRWVVTVTTTETRV